MHSLRQSVILLCAAGLLAFALPASADDADDVNRLLKARDVAAASARLDEALAKRPKDPQLRFLKGVMLANEQRDAEAIAVFLALNEDFPELAEPYNNLAVLYAGQGDYDKARVALEAAVRSNPSYATAYENLGDMYVRLAARAYARALRLDATNAALEPRIALLKGLVPDRPAPPKPATP